MYVCLLCQDAYENALLKPCDLEVAEVKKSKRTARSCIDERRQVTLFSKCKSIDEYYQQITRRSLVDSKFSVSGVFPAFLCDSCSTTRSTGWAGYIQARHKLKKTIPKQSIPDSTAVGKGHLAGVV